MTISKNFGLRTGIAGILIMTGILIGQKFSVADVSPGQVTISRLKEGTDLVAVVSHSGKTVYGLSDLTGKWAKVTVEEGVVKPGSIFAGKGIAVFFSGKQAYGFSNVTGQWSKIAFEGKPSTEPLMSVNLACFVAGTKAYAFSAQSGLWADVELGTAGAVPVPGTRAVVTVGAKVYIFSKSMKDWAVWDLAQE